MDVADLYAIVDSGEGESLFLEDIRSVIGASLRWGYWPILYHVSDLSLQIKPSTLPDYIASLFRRFLQDGDHAIDHVAQRCPGRKVDHLIRSGSQYPLRCMR